MKRLVFLAAMVMAIGCLLVACGDEFEEIEGEETGEFLDQFEESRQELKSGNCSWWNSLGQSSRNYQIILESLYSVDRNIWGQNHRIPCSWSSYLWSGCALMGNWAYSHRYPGWTGKGGQCKTFVRELLERASGGAASLPYGTYDYRKWYPYRNRQDAIRHARAGEVLQFINPLHTAVVISNFHDGRFEVVHSNWAAYEKISKQVINVNHGSWGRANLRSYVIDCY